MSSAGSKTKVESWIGLTVVKKGTIPAQRSARLRWLGSTNYILDPGGLSSRLGNRVTPDTMNSAGLHGQRDEPLEARLL